MVGAKCLEWIVGLCGWLEQWWQPMEGFWFWFWLWLETLWLRLEELAWLEGGLSRWCEGWLLEAARWPSGNVQVPRAGGGNLVNQLALCTSHCLMLCLFSYILGQGSVLLSPSVHCCYVTRICTLVFSS